ncbi:hypothetical protein HXX76_008066 [Chlamydomonas incerta]|uniref:FAD/NAD(P)-binding domain-containing protein n=1 Tax=Chlamydomonas incerta TaxID=51695 RepID=A0A835SXR5_CHLIN|nr:hypothetical protein HXX76_008066 [Chlamydomonas incerta]|eukprot:KAG2433696.1 hypothetical protein HXX76_008066 [Chlamydomonas incerta]
MDPRVAAAAAINHWDIPDLGLVLQARVTQLTSRSALLSNGDTVAFDFAAVCSGSTTSELFKSTAATSREQRLAEMKELHDEIRAAKSVLVVGGGPSGVEMAAEIVDTFAGKAVTLVHGGKRLLQELPPRAGAAAQKWLEAHHVKVMLGRRVDSKPPPDDPSIATTSATATTAAGANSGSAHTTTVGGAVAAAVPEHSWSGAGSSAHSHPHSQLAHPNAPHPPSYSHNPLLDSAGAAASGLPSVLRLSDGSSLAADVVLWCTGSRPAAGFMAGGELEGCLTEQGAIKVLPSLQVEGQPHMFALGDVNNVPEAKLGFLAAKQAEMAAASLQALARARATGGPPPKLQRWKPNGGGPAVMIVTLGRDDGVFRAGGLVCGGCVPAMVKSRGLFVSKYRKMLNVTSPLPAAVGGGGVLGAAGVAAVVGAPAGVVQVAAAAAAAVAAAGCETGGGGGGR